MAFPSYNLAVLPLEKEGGPESKPDALVLESVTRVDRAQEACAG
jgi:hypothetical protein